jgi:uncharacterized protein (DUF1697 family)
MYDLAVGEQAVILKPTKESRMAITYVAMLRGINVGGKSIRMEALRASFEELGFRSVKTYVQSGNVIFMSGRVAPSGLAKKIEAQIHRDFGFQVSVLVRTLEEMETTLGSNPLAKEKSIDPSKLHVTFLAAASPKDAIAKLEALAAKSERYCVLGREVYLYCPDGYGRTKLSNNAIERKFSLTATTRNWKTVNALLAMMQSADGN